MISNVQLNNKLTCFKQTPVYMDRFTLSLDRLFKMGLTVCSQTNRNFTAYTDKLSLFKTCMNFFMHKIKSCRNKRSK